MFFFHSNRRYLSQGWILCAFLIISSSATMAQHVEKGDTTKPYKNKLLPLPVAFYTPETKVGYGIIGMYLFKAGHDWHTRTSNFDFALIRTTRNQTIIEPTYTIFTKNEKWYIRGTWVYALKTAETWYPLGNTNTKDDGIEVEFNNFRFNNKLLKRILPHFYVGIQQMFNYVYNLNYDPAEIKKNVEYSPLLRNILLKDLSYLSHHQTTSGVGISSLFDTRDNILNPFKGVYLDGGVTYFGKELGSDYKFMNFYADARFFKHFERNKKWFSSGTLAFNAILNFNTAKDETIQSAPPLPTGKPRRRFIIENRDYRPPIHQLASLGGSTVLRGFYRGRFKDIDAVVLQTEYRQTIYNRWGMTFFGGVGEVGSELSDFDFKGLNYSYGLGLRYMAKKSERINLRLDLGFGNRDSRGIYVGIAEAF